MSRALNLELSESEIVEHCRARQIGISSIEPLPAGGVRLVCSTTSGAAEIRAKLGRKIMAEDAQRTNWRRTRPLW